MEKEERKLQILLTCSCWKMHGLSKMHGLPKMLFICSQVTGRKKKKAGGGPLLVSLGIFKCYPLCFHLLDIHLQVYTLLQIDCSFILNVLQSGLVQVFDISAELISYLDIIIP